MESLAAAEAPATDGGFDGTFTLTSLTATICVLIALVVNLVLRRLDNRARLLKDVDTVLGELGLECGRLAGRTVTKADLATFADLLNAIRDGQARFPALPLAAVVATGGAYEHAAISEECSRRLNRAFARKKSVGEGLRHTREQAAKLADVRMAVGIARAAVMVKLKR
ncbi:hypothetical protein ABT160_21925 [Streptomyces sp. NPDC001941]|uniref:hypothetical protein n=1 Tax=Streptomyces sp. NPDC001941 TaxID=3154659 RepID=UPI003321664E